MKLQEMTALMEEKMCDTIAMLLLESKGVHPEKQALVSMERQELNIKNKIKDQLHDFEAMMQRGWKTLTERIHKKAPHLLDEITSINRAIFQSQLDMDNFSQQWETGLPVWQILGITHDFIEAFHQEAILMYTEKHFEEARDAFLCLIAFDLWEQRFWIGYGLSIQFCNHANVESALDAYYIAMGIDETNPYPYIYYAECLAQLGDQKVALEFLDLALNHAAHSDQYAALISQIETIKTQVSQEVV